MHEQADRADERRRPPIGCRATAIPRSRAAAVTIGTGDRRAMFGQENQRARDVRVA